MKIQKAAILAVSAIVATLVLSGSAHAGSFWEKVGSSSRKTYDRSRTCAVDYSRGVRNSTQGNSRCYNAGRDSRKAVSSFGKSTRNAWSGVRKGWNKK